MTQILRWGDADFASPLRPRLTTCMSAIDTKAVDKPVVIPGVSTTDGHPVPSMILRKGH
jgi:hypothetical protein